MTAGLITVIATAAVMLAAFAWLRADSSFFFWTIVSAALLGALLYLDWAEEWTGYAYAVIGLAWLGWLLLPESEEEGGETVAERLVGLGWRGPWFFLVGVVAGSLAVMVGMLAVFVIVGSAPRGRSPRSTSPPTACYRGCSTSWALDDDR